MANVRRREDVAIRAWSAARAAFARIGPQPEIGRGVLVVLWTVLAGACFNPKVTSGGLVCSQDSAHLCPAGYSCVAAHCYKDGDPLTPTGGSGGVSASGGSSGSGGATGGTGGGTMGGQSGQGGGCPTRTPLCNDEPASGEVCHPACQTGACGCSSQCTVAKNGVATTGVAACAPLGTKAVGELCHLAPDDCGPGLVCQTEACGAGLARCYRFCRDSHDCNDSVACIKPVRTATGEATAYLACDVAPAVCDPIAQTGCGDPALVCYVVGPTSTRCDCLGANLSEGQPCSSSTSCAPGLECLGASSGTVICQRLCRSSADCVRLDGGVAGTCTPPSGNFATCSR